MHGWQYPIHNGTLETYIWFTTVPLKPISDSHRYPLNLYLIPNVEKCLFFFEEWLIMIISLYFLGFSIAIPLRAIALNCAQLFSNFAQLLVVYRARNCAQVKFICVEKLNCVFHSFFQWSIDIEIILKPWKKSKNLINLWQWKIHFEFST